MAISILKPNNGMERKSVVMSSLDRSDPAAWNGREHLCGWLRPAQEVASKEKLAGIEQSIVVDGNGKRPRTVFGISYAPENTSGCLRKSCPRLLPLFLRSG